MTADLVAFLRARLDEDELWATEASRSERGFVPSGVHWQWEDTGTDEVVTPDPELHAHVDDEREGAISLRSREEFPTRSTGQLPQFAIHRAEEVPAAVGGHIIRHDPARVLADVEAKRQLLDEHGDVNDGSCGTCVDGQWGYPTHGGSSPQTYPCRTLRLVASVYADHEDYRPEWAPTPA